MDPEITETDRLRMENEALRTLMGWVSSFSVEEQPDTKIRLREIVLRARELLAEIKRRRRAPKPKDVVETTCQHIRMTSIQFGVQEPEIIIERLKAWKYEAFIDGCDHIGVGQGRTAIEAVQRLFSFAKNHRERVK